MSHNDQYQKVAESEEFLNLKEQPAEDSKGNTNRFGWKKQTVIIGLAVGTLVVGLLAAIAAGNSKSHSTTAAVPSATATPAVVANTTAPAVDLEDTKPVDFEAQIEGCGNSPEEARSKDCVFDVMMQLWTPRSCYDANLTEKFLAVGNWTWWADPGATHSMTDEEMARGEHDRVYVSADYHKSHCIFAWEKLVRALRNQTPLIEQLISYDHAMHCQHKTLAALDAKGAIAPKGYTSCAPYSVWVNALPADHMSSTD